MDVSFTLHGLKHQKRKFPSNIYCGNKVIKTTKLFETNKLINMAITSRSVVFKPQLLTIQLPWTNLYVGKRL